MITLTIKTLFCLVCLDEANHLHHIIPRSAGGQDVKKNLAPLCWKCHDRIHAEGWDTWVNYLVERKGVMQQLWT